MKHELRNTREGFHKKEDKFCQNVDYDSTRSSVNTILKAKRIK
jgi:hypothetical protein